MMTRADILFGGARIPRARPAMWTDENLERMSTRVESFTRHVIEQVPAFLLTLALAGAIARMIS
jgi:hypothetical protein